MVHDDVGANGEQLCEIWPILGPPQGVLVYNSSSMLLIINRTNRSWDQDDGTPPQIAPYVTVQCQLVPPESRYAINAASIKPTTHCHHSWLDINPPWDS